MHFMLCSDLDLLHVDTSSTKATGVQQYVLRYFFLPVLHYHIGLSLAFVLSFLRFVCAFWNTLKKLQYIQLYYLLVTKELTDMCQNQQFLLLSHQPKDREIVEIRASSSMLEYVHF